jgi:hypothetical protein
MVLSVWTVILLFMPLVGGSAEPPPTSGSAAEKLPHSIVQTLHPVVEIEEDVYSYHNANNGAGPMWCSGSTCLVRVGDNLFASGLETLDDIPPLNNCRWMLFQRGRAGWKLQRADQNGRTREPSPLAGFPDGRLILSANPTLGRNPEPNGGPAQPQLLQFSADKPGAPFQTILPGWKESPPFSEHSYRSLAADGPNRELILFQNIGYTHAEWAFRDGEETWVAQGQLRWPWGAEYDKPQPIRVCYPNVALHNRAVHFCGVSDILEPYEKFRDYKKQLTGRHWDYDFRRLFYTWTPDITTGKFGQWVEIASRDKTCGWISPGDLWVAPDGAAHLLWSERAIDERLRQKFFPDARQSHALNYAIVKEGKVVLRRTLMEAVEGESREVPSSGRFHVTPGGRLFVLFYVNGVNSREQSISENRLMEILSGGQTGPPVRVPLESPFRSYFTTTPRAGSPPSRHVEILGQRVGAGSTISYAKIRLW